MKDGQDSHDIIQAIRAGDQDAMLTFYDTYFGLVAGFCRKMIGDRGVADEVIQDVFWQVWRQAGDYNPERAQISTWLLTIARSRVIDALRRLKRQGEWIAWEESDGLLEARPGAPSTDVERAVEANMERHRIRQALEDLPPPQKEALYRVHLEGRTAKDVADHENVPIGTIKTRLRLGLDKLRKALEVEADDA